MQRENSKRTKWSPNIAWIFFSFNFVFSATNLLINFVSSYLVLNHEIK